MSTLQRSVSFVPMQFLLDVQAIAGSNGYSSRPWVLPSSSDGDGENGSFSSYLNLRWVANYGRTIRERHWKAKYALYSICPRNEEESTNTKKHQSSGEDKDNDKHHLCAGRNKDFECERNRVRVTMGGWKCNTISSELNGERIHFNPLHTCVDAAYAADIAAQLGIAYVVLPFLYNVPTSKVRNRGSVMTIK